MKYLNLLEPLVIAGVLTEPGGDPLPFEDDAAQALIDAEQAELVSSDGLDLMKVDQLNEIASAEAVSLNGATRKADIIAAIRAHRSPPPAE